MARNASAITIWSQYLAARLTVMGLTSLDVEPNLRVAAQLGRLLYRIDKRHRERAIQAIAQSMPELAAVHVRSLAQRSFEHFVQLLIEVMHMPRLLNADTWPKRVKLTNLGRTIHLLNDQKPVLLVTGHLGNWEVLGYLLAVLGCRIHAIARPIDNPLINRWLLSIRESKGMRIITKWNALNRIHEVLDHGHALGFIADQNAGNRGLFVPFFGQLASTYKSIGLLALQRQIPVVCGWARRCRDEQGFTWELGVMDVISEEDWADRPDPLYYVTARFMRAIEMMVRECPEQYLWMHRRWKSRPRHERSGAPIPARLRRNLESLPWMDQTLMDRLARPCRSQTP